MTKRYRAAADFDTFFFSSLLSSRSADSRYARSRRAVSVTSKTAADSTEGGLAPGPDAGGEGLSHVLRLLLFPPPFFAWRSF